MNRKSLLIIFSFCTFITGFAQVTLTSSNLPIVVINTNGVEIPGEPKITADMKIIYNGEGKRNQVTDNALAYQGKIGIEVRGQSSQMFPMKAYSIELRNSQGVSIPQSLFGMPAESDWNLYAPYTDKTLMRNVLAYQISREMGNWASRCKYVEVILNGDYRGVYVLMEKIKRDPGRVNVAKLNTTDISGDAVTGGYIFSLDKEPNGWVSNYSPYYAIPQQGRMFTYVYPKVDVIVPEQKKYIQSFVDSFEAALASSSFQDPQKGVRRFANLNAFVDYFIVNEVSRNVDAYRFSSYLFKDRNSIDRRICAGPVWDYDLAFRNANYCNGSDISGWAYLFNQVCPGNAYGLVPFWWERLMNDTAYVSELRCRWLWARKTVLDMKRISSFVDSVGAHLDEASKRHFTRWPILGQYIWPNPNPIPKTYAEELLYLKAWIESRMNWLDSNIPDKGGCSDYTDVVDAFSSSVFPNPVTGTSTIRLRSKDEQTLYLRAIHMSGYEVWRNSINVKRGSSNDIKLPFERMNSGIYILEITGKDGKVFRHKILKSPN